MWTKEKLLKSETKTVKVCGDEIILRKLKAGEIIGDGKDEASSSFRLVSASLINPEMSVAEVKELPADFFNDLIKEVNNLNGIGKEAEEETRKN